MSALALMLALGCAPAAPPDPAPSSESPSLGVHTLTVFERSPLAFVLITPSGEGGATGTSALIRSVATTVERHTDLVLRPVPAAEIRECAGRLACMVRKARPDYDRFQYELPNGQLAPFDDHLEHLKRKEIRYPEYLLVISNVTGDAKDRLSVTMLDTNAALRVAHDVNPRREGAAARIELEVRNHALLAPPERGEVANADEADQFLARVFVQSLRRRLSAEDHWQPYGTIELQLPEAGHTVHIDGRAVGTAQTPRTRIEGVRAGPHRLALTRPDYETYETQIVVERKEALQLQPNLQKKASGTALAVRRSVLWSGVALVAAGAVMTSVAVGRAQSDVVTVCPVTAGEMGCRGSQFITGGYQPDVAPTLNANVNPDGVLLAPLGYSLAATGAIWSLGTWLFGDDDDFPWWQLAAGLVAGGVSYGVSHALNPSGP